MRRLTILCLAGFGLMVGAAAGADFRTLEVELMPGAPEELVSAVAAVNGGDDAKSGAAVIARLAREGNANAAFGLGWCYQVGRGVEASTAEARKAYQMAADAGHLGGQLALGMLMLAESQGDEVQVEEGVGWIKRAADKGQVDAQRQLGRIYANGMGVEKDVQMGRAWLTMAADNGDAEASFDLGKIAEAGGDGSKPDGPLALKHFQKAAEGGSVKAIMYLARGYQLGAGEMIERDLVKAVKWYAEAAKKGVADAAFELGQIYQAGGNGVERDLEKAVGYYSAAAENGQVRAQFRMAIASLKGEGLAKDEEGGKAWLKKAAEGGSSEAMFQLGLFHASGEAGFEKSAALAAEWYKKAGYLGHALAQNELASYYRDGTGIMEDHVAAVAWFSRAATAGLPDAQVNLGDMYAYGLGAAQDFGNAGFWYEKAVAAGVPTAMHKMANLLEVGAGAEPNLVGAYVLYLQAAESIEEAKSGRDRVKAKLSPAQLNEARNVLKAREQVRGGAGAGGAAE